MSVTARAIVGWLILFVAMFANGALRVLALQPQLGEDRARQVASLTGILIVLFVSYVFVRVTPQATTRKLVRVGAAWVAGTLAFEFLFGHFVSGLGWTDLLADFNLFRGRLWSLVVVSVCLGPWACGVLGRRRIPGAAGSELGEHGGRPIAGANRASRLRWP